MCEWESDEEDKRASIAIFMPSGLSNRNMDHSLRVLNDGRALHITVVRPRAMSEMIYLHKLWIEK